MSDQQAVAAPAKTPRGRSPSYPGIPLPTAIDRVRTIYDHAQRHPVPLASVTAKWGYKAATTGPATVTYSALKKFGLVDEEGTGSNRVVHVTDLAVRILHPNPEQDGAIREAALTPSIMREWWQRFGTDLPPEDSLRWDFAVQGAFTETGLSDFVRVYKETIAFAHLSAGAPVGTEAVQQDQGPQDRKSDTKPSVDRSPEQRRERSRSAMTYQVPLRPGQDIVVEFPYPPSAEDYDFFLSMLQAVKSRLLATPDASTAENQIPTI